jgi:uncharacterized protein (DUF433 family)
MSGCPTKRSSCAPGSACSATPGGSPTSPPLDHDDGGEQVFTQLPADHEFPDIVINPARMSGQPTFVGSRISPVTNAGTANGGMRHEDIAADYGLSLQQVQQAIDYTKKYRLEAA